MVKICTHLQFANESNGVIDATRVNRGESASVKLTENGGRAKSFIYATCPLIVIDVITAQKLPSNRVFFAKQKIKNKVMILINLSETYNTRE